MHIVICTEGLRKECEPKTPEKIAYWILQKGANQMTDSQKPRPDKYSYLVDDTMNLEDRIALLGHELRSHLSIINGCTEMLKQLEIRGSKADLATHKMCVESLANSGNALQAIYSALHKYFDRQ